MTSLRSRWVFLLVASVGLTSPACQKAGDGDVDGMGGAGGEEETGGGGSGGGGRSGGKGGGGSGGASGGSNGGASGGSSGGASGGSSGASGAQAGAAGGASGGSTGGAVAGAAGGAMAGAAGMPMVDPNVPVHAPECTYRYITDDPNYKNCGPLAGVLPPAGKPRAGAPGWCTDNSNQYTNDGTFMVSASALDSAAKNNAAKGQWIGTQGLQGLRDIYMPPGYEQAEDGRVGVSFWLGAFGARNSMNIEGIHDYLIGRKEIPYTIVVFVNSNNDPGRVPEYIARFKTNTIPGLKAKYPKLAMDPRFRVIGGQSTDGTVAFDAMWMGTDVVSNGIGGSPSMVCFGCLGAVGHNKGYVNHVSFCPKKPIRWTGTVGLCDIWGTLQERLAAKCDGSTGAGSVDASTCAASWLPANKELTDALKAKGMPHQLFIMPGGHSPTTWGGVALAQQLRWVFKDVTCFE